MKRYLALILAAMMLAALLQGCGGMSTSLSDSIMSNGKGMALEEYSMAEPGDAGLVSSSGSIANAPEVPTNQKLIRKLRLNAETDDLDAIMQKVDEKIAALSGYAENREVYNSGSRRHASLIIRIPATQADQFVDHVAGMTNVTSSTETAEDITLTYVATESRVKALQTEHDRLLELLEKAENMDDLLQIEKRLTEVRADLEEVASKLRLYDNMVDYATVTLTIYEVKEYTDVTEPETVWQRISKGFMESLEDLGDFFTELFVFVVVGIPYFVLLAVVILLIVLWVKHNRKKRIKRYQNMQQQQQQQ